MKPQDKLIKELKKKPLPEMPSDIREKLAQNKVTPVVFRDKNRLLEDESLHDEAGFVRLPDGNYYVAMYCPMPGITMDMIHWWFWWHANASERYRVWFPGEHFAISYARKNKSFFGQPTCPPFEPNTHYPVEKIGKIALPLRIRFVDPQEFGFSKELMQKGRYPWAVNGHVGAMYGLVEHTEMAHILKETDDGLLMINRFWIGQTLKNPIIRKAMLNDDTARDMVEHCCIEYRNLAAILPKLYETYGP